MNKDLSATGAAVQTRQSCARRSLTESRLTAYQKELSVLSLVYGVVSMLTALHRDRVAPSCIVKAPRICTVMILHSTILHRGAHGAAHRQVFTSNNIGYWPS